MQTFMHACFINNQIFSGRKPPDYINRMLRFSADKGKPSTGLSKKVLYIGKY
jgi:hypothetical protein